MRLYWEWVKQTNVRCGNMVSEEVLSMAQQHQNAGFRSVYGFSEEDAATIRSARASVGFVRFVPGAYELVIDLDDGDKTLPIALGRVLARGLRCEVWSSGGKGYHLVLRHELIYDRRLPYSHFLFVSNLMAGLQFDSTLYRPSSLISLPGRLHNKTKRRKRLIEVWEGDLVKIDLVERPEPTFNKDGDVSMLQEAISHLQDLSVRQPRLGQRHNRIWLCARCFYEAGVSMETAKELLTAVNDSWDEAKTVDEVEAAVKQAYSG